MTDQSENPDTWRNKTTALNLRGFEAEFIKPHDVEVLVLREIDGHGDLRMYVREARAIRDFLNKVLP